MVKQFRNKPKIIEAIQFTNANLNEIIEFCPYVFQPDYLMESVIFISRLGYETRGSERAFFGDWIIKTETGEFYACPPDEFKKLYEPA